MKKIVYYIAVALLGLNFGSCSDFLDLPSKSKTDSESVFSSIDKAEMAVLACYTGVWMQDAWYKAQNGTDEMWSTESNSNANNYAANYVLNDQSCPTGIYTTSYSSIERCNSCLKGLRAMSLSGEDGCPGYLLSEFDSLFWGCTLFYCSCIGYDDFFFFPC